MFRIKKSLESSTEITEDRCRRCQLFDGYDPAIHGFYNFEVTKNKYSGLFVATWEFDIDPHDHSSSSFFRGN